MGRWEVFLPRNEMKGKIIKYDFSKLCLYLIYLFCSADINQSASVTMSWLKIFIGQTQG